MATFEGEFKRVARRKKRKAASNNVGSIGTDVYDALHTDPYPPLTTGKTGNQSILDQFKQKYNDAVAEFQNASAQLDNSADMLLSIQSDALNDPQFADAWQSNYNKVNALQATRDATFNDIETVRGWIESAKQSFGLAAVIVVPWATVAAIGAATAAILAVVFAANNFYNMYMRHQVDVINIERAQNGEAPIDYPEPIETGFGNSITSIFGNISTVAQTLIIGAVIFFLMRD